jgi:hypothetical protein
VSEDVEKILMFNERSDWIDDRYPRYATFANGGRYEGAGVGTGHTTEEGLSTRDDSRQSRARLGSHLNRGR